MSKAKSQDEEGNELFFVEVNNPPEVKRNILESLKDILELLQRFERFKRVRHEKLTKIQKLRVLIRDANKMLANLKSKLPQTSFKGYVREEPRPQKKKIIRKESAEKAQKKEKTELEKLEEELKSIESKLKSFT